VTQCPNKQSASGTTRFIRPSTTTNTLSLWTKSVLNALAFFALFLALLPWLAHRALPVALPLGGAVSRIAAGALCAAAVVVWAWCLAVFSQHGRGTPFPLDAPRYLVTRGPYGIVRNPIMAAEIAIAWGEALYVGSLGVLLYAVLLTVSGHVVVVKVEEPELRARIGEAYERYCTQVPRWFPRLWRRHAVAGRGS
jgi:protein-S-isoprenylcysteine O-methyltransferase Ste14